MNAPAAHEGYLGVAKRLLLWALLIAAVGGSICILPSGVLALLFERDQKSDRAEHDITNIQAALAAFRKQEGDWPPEQGWIAALIEARIIEGEPLDPWDQTYRYRLETPDGGPAVPVVTSIGRDGVADTDDDLPRRTSFR